MSEVVPLFSSPIFISDTHINRVFPDVLQVCETLDYVVNKENNFASTDTNILDHPAFIEIKQLVLETFNEYVNNIMKWTSNEIYITQSWVNVNPPGTSHHYHYHYNSIISGVFYLQTVENDTITFYRDEKTLLRIEPSEFNIWNCDSYDVPVKTGIMVIFPSHLSHGVRINQETIPDRNRISIAVNTFIRGTLGTEQNLTYLDLK